MTGGLDLTALYNPAALLDAGSYTLTGNAVLLTLDAFPPPLERSAWIYAAQRTVGIYAENRTIAFYDDDLANRSFIV